MTTTPIPSNPAVPAATPRTLSVLSLVAAVASIPLGHFVLLPIAAIVLGFFARSREPWARTMSTWGIVLGFVILFWWVIVGAIAAAFWVPLALTHLVH
jgi:hypothetical protein